MGRLTKPLVAGAVVVAALSLVSPAVASAQAAMPPTGTQLAELAGPGAIAGDLFGYSAAVSGTTMVVGEPAVSRDGIGGTFVFTKTTRGWQPAAELDPPDGVDSDAFGDSVAISASTVVVGAPWYASDAGRAYVFTRAAGGWDETELTGSGTGAGDYFGGSVAISGSTIVVGAGTGYDWGGRGRAYVFTKTGSGWHQAAELRGDPGDSFGSPVAISGSTIAIGGPNSEGTASVYLFNNSSHGWHQTSVLNNYDGDGFGQSLAISGSTLAVGATFHGGSGQSLGPGVVYVFTGTAQGWVQTAVVKGSDTVGGDMFGDKIALSGTTLVSIAPAHGSWTGRAYLFAKTATGWLQRAEVKGSDTASKDGFGASVAVSGPTVVVGESGYASGTGRAYVFQGNLGAPLSSPAATSTAKRAGSKLPDPDIAAFIPANYRVTSVERMDLDGNGANEEAITAVGVPAPLGYVPTTVVLIAWDPFAKRWTKVFDAAQQTSYQTGTQEGQRGPGLISPDGTPPKVAVMRDLPGGSASLVYWVPAVAGNTTTWLIGIVNFKNQIANLAWSTGQNVAHIESYGVRTRQPYAAPAVIGRSPHQELLVTAPWETSDDNQSYAVRQYTYEVGPVQDGPGFYYYRAFNDTRSLVGVTVMATYRSSGAKVASVYPGSPAAGKLKVGDLIERVAGAPRPPYAGVLNGPMVIDQVALFYPGQEVRLDVERAGHQLIVPITLGRWSADMSEFVQSGQQLLVLM